MQIKVKHNPEQSRFEAVVDGVQSVADYHLADGVMVMTHTHVPPSLEGRGIAAQLVGSALQHASEQGLKVDPRCSYVQKYMQQHPETAALHV